MKQLIQKINILLNKKQKRELIFLAILSVFGGFLETLSISIIVPYISIVVNPDILVSSKWGRVIQSKFSYLSFQQLLIILTLILMAAFLIKNIFLYILKVKLRNFTVTNYYLTSSKLFHSYLMKPYPYFTNHNTSEIISIITNHMTQCFSFLQSSLSLFTEAVVMVLLLFLMLAVNWQITIITFVFIGSVSLLLRKLIAPKLTEIGNKSNYEYIKMLRAVKDSFSGIKEIKLMQREQSFLNIYDKSGHENIRLETVKSCYSEASSRIVETITVWEILIFILIILICNTSSGSIFTQLAAMGLVAIRLMPCMNRINAQCSILAHSKGAFMEITDEIEEYLKHNAQATSCKIVPLDFEESIQLNNISFKFPNTDDYILNDVTLKINKGERIGIIGSSGNGKTTLVDLIMGFWTPTSGTVTVDGKNIHDHLPGWFSHIGYIPQMIFMLDGTIFDNVAFGHPEATEEKVWEALQTAHLSEYIASLPDGLYTYIGENGIRLSGGQRQRLGIARALYSNPDFLVFDEATSALNTELESEISETIYELNRNKTILIIAHRHSTLKGCDYIIEVANGKIQKHSVEEISEK